MALVFGVSSAQAEPSFQGLGDLPQGIFKSHAYAVSADGSTVVGESESRFGLEAFRWTQAGGMVGLGYLSNLYPQSHAYGVSADGSVVVGVSKVSIGTGTAGFEAFRWTQAGGMLGLGNFQQTNFESRAFGVSDDGSVVAGYGKRKAGTGTSYFEAARWTNGGTVIEGLGDLPLGSTQSRAYGISGDGAVVVGQGTGASGLEAFMWTPSDGMVGLGDLAGGSSESIANATCTDGSVIVGYGNSVLGVEAFMWMDGDGMVGLGDLDGGGFESVANAVSSAGDVVVGYGTSASGTEAFLWREASGMRSLQTYLEDDLGLDLTGWTLTSAEGISANGGTIVGWGTNPSGQEEAWLATIPVPEPSATLLQGAAILVLMGVVGRTRRT